MARQVQHEQDRGSASVELVIVFPALLLLITALVQYGLWFHARSLALAAAQEGVAGARTYGASPDIGPDVALAFIREHGGETLLGAAATTGAAGVGHVSVVVTGQSLSVLPGVPGIQVRQSAAGPLERFTTTGAP